MWLRLTVDDKLLDTLDFPLDRPLQQRALHNASRCLAQLTQPRSCASVAARDICPFFRDVAGNGRPTSLRGQLWYW